jgi:hypothetical protein
MRKIIVKLINYWWRREKVSGTNDSSENKLPEMPWIEVTGWIEVEENGVPTRGDFTILVQVETKKNWVEFRKRCGPPGSIFSKKIEELPAIWKQSITEIDKGKSIPENHNDSLSKASKEKPRYTISEIVRLKIKNVEVAEGRALLCLCNRGKTISITIRVMSRLRKDKSDKSTKTSQTPPPLDEARDKSQYIAKDKENIFCGCDILCELLDKDLFPGNVQIPPQGLLVISGLTNSGKSLITRGLIWNLIYKLLTQWDKDKSKRCVHLLTYEDPIETPIFSIKEFPLELDHSMLEHIKLDCTPREEASDTSGLRQVLQDALRQTPSVVYVGEVRNLSEWRAIFDFAGTGHFIVATTHAGSLTETFRRMFQSVDAKLPADKGIYAQRLFGVINLRMVSVPNEKDQEKKIVEVGRISPRPGGKAVDEKVNLECFLPTVWRRTTSSLAKLISEGLASLLPTCCARVDSDESSMGDDVSCYGRTHYAIGVVKKIRELENIQIEYHEDIRRKLVNTALELDLKGE